MHREKLKEHFTDLKRTIDSLGGIAKVYERLDLSVLCISLLRVCNKDKEKINLYGELPIDKHYQKSIFIPNGINSIGIPPNSYIEFKQNLISDTIYKEDLFARLYKERHPESRTILVYKESDISEELLEQAKNSALSVEITEYEEFIRYASSSHKIPNITITELTETWEHERNNILRKARSDFWQNKVTFFLGAGVSQSAGGPSWEELLLKVYKQTHKGQKISKSHIKKISNSCAHSSIIIGRYIMSDSFETKDLAECLRNKILYKNVKKSSPLIDYICKAVETKQLESIITYNYDDLVETALENNNIKVARIYNKSRHSINEFPIYHVHGIVTQEEKYIESTPVLSEYDYHNIYRESYNWSNVEQLHALDRNICFFIGLSLTDPNLRRLLDFSFQGGDCGSYHYAFIQRMPLREGENYKQTNEQHFQQLETQMHSLGINIIWYHEYAEIPKFIRRIIEK